MNPWDNDAPWINALRISKEAKQALWSQVQAGNVTQEEAQSYNWGTLSTVADFLRTTFNSRVTGVPVKELQKAYTDLETIRTRIDTTDSEIAAFESALTASKTDNIKVGNRTYDRDRATELFNDLRDNRKMLDDSLNKLLVRMKITEFDIQARKDYAEGFWKRYQSTKDPEDFKKWQEASKGTIEQAVSAVNRPGPTVRAGVGGVARTTLTAAQAATEEQMRTEAAAGRVTTITPAGTPSPAGAAAATSVVGGPVTKAQVNAALAASGLADTPENRKLIRADLKAGKEPMGDWLTKFKQEFPQYTYLLDETTFGADMTELLQRAVTQKWYDSDQLETLMNQGFAGTQYYKNTTTAQQNFDKLTPANKQAQIDQFKLVVQQTFGNLQFDDATLTNIATKAARDNRQGKALELYVYQESFAKPVGATGFVQPTAATRALTSSAADEIRQIGRDYGSRVTDQEVQDVLTGKTTIDSLRQTYKMAAKRWYKGAADDIDAGVTVEQLFRPYKQYAAAILGKPLEQIDLIDANGAPTLYAQALEGKDGPMSISEWTQKLKSDDRFGWQFTSEAKQKATSLVMDLEKAFGFRA